MNSRLKMYFVLFMLVLFSVCSCATQQKTGGFNKESGKYYNSEIGFEIDISKDWYVLSDEQIENMTTTMWDKTIEKGLMSKEEVEDAAKLIFCSFKYRPNIDVEKHPNIKILFENPSKTPNIQIVIHDIEKYPTIKTEFDYLAYDPEFKSSKPTNLNPSSVFKEQFSNKDFYFLDFSEKKDTDIAINKRYTTLVGKFALSITVSYFNEEQKKEIEGVLETMKFEK